MTLSARILTTFVAAAGCLCATQQSSGEAKKSTDGSAVPAESKHITDADGKKWVLVKTPFGVAKVPEKEPEAASSAAPPATAGLKATEVGDSVKFERKTPFGPSTWTKKKTDLDETEQAAWNAAKASKKSAPAKAAQKQAGLN